MMMAMDNAATHPKHAFRARWKSALDYLIFILLLILALMPMSRIPSVVGGRGVNMQVPLEVMLAFVLIARILFVGASGKFLPFLLLSLALTIYSAFSIVILNVPVGDVIFHIQLLLPFVVACLILWSGLSIPPKRFLFGLSIALGVSALLSLYLFYLNPQLILSTYADRHAEYAALIGWGRNFFWFNLPAAYFPWVTYLIYKGKSRLSLGLLIGSVVTSVFGMLSLFSRTHLLAYALLVMFSVMAGASYRLKRIVFRLFFMAILLMGLAFVYFSSSEKAVELFGGRISPLISEGTSAIPVSHITTRTNLYDQYLESFLSNPVFGVGLGVPFATDPVNSFYTDVTIVSFGVTFGVVGVFIFGVFVYTLWHSLAKVRNEELKPAARILIQLILVALLVSLNDNIWSYKPFVIYLAAATASIGYADAIHQEKIPLQ